KYLDDNDLLVNIIEDKEFEQSRNYLPNNLRVENPMRRKKSNSLKLINFMTKDFLEEETLCHCKEQCGGTSHFILVFVQETDQENYVGECLVLIKERGSKTRQGKENEEKRFYNPCVYAIVGDR
uniref:Uncharacterized protein n=1 Tax=Clytia hemisphaerica TaxID=252671 RepID=A0A7M5V528_9CNID